MVNALVFLANLTFQNLVTDAEDVYSVAMLVKSNQSLNNDRYIQK